MLYKIERSLMLLLLVQFICLLLVQLLLTQEHAAQYMSRLVYYEGVTKQTAPDAVETQR